MKNPYLIQRMRFTGTKDGSFDDVISLDYMGSAEFEFGACAKSLQYFCKRVDSLVIRKSGYTHVKDSGAVLYLISTPALGDAYKKDHMRKLADPSYRLKEYSFIPEMLGKSTMFHSNKPDAWWDIDNHVMLTIGLRNAERILKTIKVTRDKKKKEGKTDWF